MEIGKCKTQVDKFNRFPGSRLTGHQVDRSPGLQVGENAGWQVTGYRLHMQLWKILQNCEVFLEEYNEFPRRR